MDDLERFTADVRERVAALGFELVDLRASGAGTRARVQLRVDRPDSTPGHGVTIDDCATISRALESWLDATGVFGPRYVLEVSSPGIERPVRWPEHWRRFIGRDVRVRLPERGRIQATIVRVVEDRVVLKPVGETVELDVPLVEARGATLVADSEWQGAHDTSRKE